jgi:hypothetical protein
MDLSTIVDVFSIIAVASGLVFAGLELRHFRKTRERESALELFSTIQSPEFIRGVRAITELPDNLNCEEVERAAGEKMDDLFLVAASMEGLGALVHGEELSINMVERFFGGTAIFTWKKLAHYFREKREELGRETWGEWVQWLAEKVMEREASTGTLPAYTAYRDWQPG